MLGRWNGGDREEDSGKQKEIWNEKELSSYGLIAGMHSQNGSEKAGLYSAYAYRAAYPGQGGVKSGHVARAFFWNAF